MSTGARRLLREARRLRAPGIAHFGQISSTVVVCSWTLYHLQTPDDGVGEFARVLRPGGRFVGIYNRDRQMEELWSLCVRRQASGTITTMS